MRKINLFTIMLLLGLTVPATSQSNEGYKFGIGFSGKVSTLGPGFDVAVPIASRVNVRGGFNAFGYDHTFTDNGITYVGNLHLRSVNALLDFFPRGGGFHISGGALLYNENRVTANDSVPAGQPFSLGGTSYRSNGITGTGRLDLNKAAPMVLLGFGNIVPRTKHFSVSTEFGAVFQGVPKTALALAGSACDPTGLNCRNIATDPTIQSNIQAQQKKIDDDVKILQYYPVVSFGINYRF